MTKISRVWIRALALLVWTGPLLILASGCGGAQSIIPADRIAPSLADLSEHPSISATVSFIYRFSGSDGAAPIANVTIDSAGNLFGVTSTGGANGYGTVFKLTPGSGNYTLTTLHNFMNADGASPRGGLALVGQTLYGTTYAGGKSGVGTVFTVDTTGQNFRVLHHFGGIPDGALPLGKLTWRNGAVFGTTSAGGVKSICGNGCGTIFRVTAAGQEKVIYRFGGQADGERPLAGLTVDPGGTFWGTTATGGLEFKKPSDCVYTSSLRGCGTIFSLVYKSGRYEKRTVYRLAANQGYFPAGALVLDGGAIYGTTEYGSVGEHIGGAVFSLVPSGTTSFTYKALYEFSNGDGSVNEITGDIVEQAGTVFGTSFFGGSSGNGSLFTATTGSGSALYYFGSPKQQGISPTSGLTSFGSQMFGTTQAGGGCSTISNGCGTVFRVTLQ